MNKKIKIIFDVSILSNALRRGSCRSGIFFVAHNILKELSKRRNIELSFYFRNANDEIAISNYLKRENIVTNVSSIRYSKKLNSRFSLLRRNFCIVKFLHIIIKVPITLTNKLHTKYFRVPTQSKFFLSPLFAIPKDIKQNQNIKKFVIVYDMIPYIMEEYSWLRTSNSWFSELMNSVDKADKNEYLFAISKNTKNDLTKYKGSVRPNSITVLPLAASDRFYKYSNLDTAKDILKKHNLLGKKYILSVSNLDLRKNITHTLDCFIKYINRFKITDLYFVVIGQEVKNKSMNQIDVPKSEKIIFLGYVDDKDLTPLYNGAKFFVYMSLYEGFGLPPLEAMKCGVPVISSNTSSLPEVVGNAGIMLDPKDGEGLISEFNNLYDNLRLRKKMTKRGLKRAKQFSWKKTVDIIVTKFGEFS